MNLNTEARGPRDPLWARLVVVIALAMPLIFYAAYSGTYFSWGDEVQFVDPAASAYLGQGFTSMAWPYQSSVEFFAGNAPGYSILLLPWFWIWGLGLEQARWLNIPLAGLSAWLLLRGLRNACPSMPWWLAAIAICASLLGAGVLVSAGSARYDMLCLLVASWIFWVLSRGAAGASRAPLLAAGAAAVYAGFHLVAGLVFVMLFLVVLDRRHYLDAALSLLVGSLLGLASWLVVLASNGLFVKFFVMLFGSQHTISGQVAKLVLQGDKGAVLGKEQALRGLVSLDPSLSIVAGFLILLIAMRWFGPGSTPGSGKAASDERTVGWLAIGFAFILPVALLMIGKFPVYYSWMAYIPALLIAAHWSWRCFERGLRWPIAAFVLVAGGASAVGLYERISHRDVDMGSARYADFDVWVRRQLSPADLVYADFEAYFPARAAAQRVLVPTYAQTALVRGIPERDRVSALLVHVSHLSQSVTLLGGEWHEVARYSGAVNSSIPPKLEFVLLRRSGRPPA